MKYLPLNQPCLKWEKSFDCYRFLIENHILRLINSFKSLLNQNGFISLETKDAWLRLKNEDQISLILDPDAAEIIITAKEDLNLALQNRLNVQLESLMKAVLSKTGHCRREPLYTSNGIRVDSCGFLHGLGNPKIQSTSENEARFFLQQIDKALAIIAEVSPEALSLINNFTNTIHIRRNPYHPNYSSWSTHIGIGKITASNFHEVANDIAEVVDFLIHESIHNFLHLVEEEYGPFLEDEAYSASWIKEKIVPSPWSGKKIDLGSYTHAISVWYGLARFWIKAQDYRGDYACDLPLARIQKMVDQASEGFLKNRNVHLVAADHFSYINKDFLACSLNFQPEICALRIGASRAV
jgi:hypothetical protein